MVAPRKIDFDEFARTVEAVFDDLEHLDRSVLVERHGDTYRVEREGVADIWAGYSAQRLRRALRESAGAFRGLDRDAFLADLESEREQRD